MDGRETSPAHGRHAAQRCTATSRQAGRRCKRHAIPGGMVCVMHGGTAPQVAAAARQRLERAAAAQAVTRLGLGPFPVEIPDPLAKLARVRRHKPRWFVAAEARLWEQAASASRSGGP